jgi:opacity protein-like surface antigen
VKPKEVATPNFLLKQAASFILSGTTDMASHPAFFGVVNLPRVASDLRSQHSVRSRSPNHWRVRAFSRFYENVLASAILLLAVTMLIVFFADPTSAQEPTNNEFAVWFADQFASAYAFSEETNGHIYLIETRYTRMILARPLIAVRYVADVAPWAVVGDPRGPEGSLVYAHGVGGSPVGLQVNFLHDRHVQPFITSGGGFLYFNRRMFGTKQQFNFTAQFGGGVQLLNPSRRASLYLGYMYHHISNANMDRTNPGLGSHTLFVGVSFLR